MFERENLVLIWVEEMLICCLLML